MPDEPHSLEDPLSMFRMQVPELDDNTGNPPPENKDKDKDKDRDKKAKDKQEQVAELRKAKDKAIEELRLAKEEIEKAKELSVLVPVAEYLKKKAGKLDEDVVNKYIETGKERKKLIEESKQKLLEKEEALRNISVDHSEEFQRDYIAPMHKERSSLIALVANVNNEGKIKHPQLVEEFFKRITKIDDKGRPMDSLSIKKELVAFESEYKKATGEDYELPQLNQLVNQVESFTGKVVSVIDAKRNWEKVKEEKDKEHFFEQSKAEEARIKKEIEGRLYITKKVIDEFDYSSIEDIIPKDDFETAITDNNKYLTGIITKDKSAKQKDYKELLVDMSKASVFDTLIEKFRELQEELKTEKAKNKSGLPNNGGLPKNNQQQEKKDKNYEPLSMFR